jgi:uncharacterized protein
VVDRIKLSLSVLNGSFAICKLDRAAEVPAWALASEFFSVTRTPDELSIVCDSKCTPLGASCEDGWRCLQIHGPLSFNLTGILNSITGPLAEAGVGIFAVSTFETDFVLVKDYNLQRAIDALTRAGHKVQEESIQK